MKRGIVVIPTYNEAENLPLLIPEVLAQDERIEILVVDDHSPDGTGKIADEFAERDPRVHVLHRERKAGLGGAYRAGLRKALDMLFEEGLENVFERHRLLAEAVRRAVMLWSQGGALTFNIIESDERADSVTPVIMANGAESQPLLDFCHKKCGVVLGTAIGDYSGRGFRIAHMGHVNAPMILGTLSVTEVGLNALGIPHGKGGVQAAIDWLGESVPV